MKKEYKCFKCNKSFNWDNIIWNISIVPGYKTRIYKCECNHEQSLHIPITKEKKDFWRKIL